MHLSYSVARVNIPARRAQIRRRRARRARPRRGPTGGVVSSGCTAGRCAPLGILLDYAAGVIPAAQLRAAGASGAIRYVSDRRPGGDWMLGKPIQLPEARDLYQNGMKIVSCYQYGKQDSADWLGGQNAGVAARQAGLATARRGGRIVWRADLRVDRRQPQLRPVQEPGGAVSARVGSGAGPSACRGVRQRPDDRLGAARRAGFLLLAAQLGLAPGVHASGRAPAPGRDRQSQRSGASGSTSTRSSSPSLGSGTKRY